VWLLLIATLTSSCALRPRWRADDQPTAIDVVELMEAGDPSAIFRNMHASEIPVIPTRQHLRPCCAFGAQLGAQLGPIPIPGISIGNILDADELGYHYYDAGILLLGSRGDDDAVVRSERNGLVYTCRGGFIDTAHVRDYADWTIFLGTNIARHLETGVTLQLPGEGATLQIVIHAADPARLDGIDRRRLAIPLPQWLAFQLSVWHEIATWYGWSTVAAFPERVSAFSPEDLYSNLVGTKIAGAVAAQRSARSEFLYNRSVDHWIAQILRYLEATPAAVGRDAMRSVDMAWWDSGRRLPDPRLVLRRNMDLGTEIRPWLAPFDRATEALRAACPPALPPVVLANPDAVDGLQFRDQATLRIEVGAMLAAQEPFRSLGGVITQEDFPAILAAVRAENQRQFGPVADRPEL
jgi:hypothetical protein